MKKLFFKSLRNNIKHYMVVIMCGILTIATVYVSIAFSDSMEMIVNGQESGIREEIYSFINFCETYFLLFLLMILVILSYIRKKSYDYALLDMMGIQKKHKYQFIGFEYLGIVLGSMTGGLILGKILAEAARRFLLNTFHNVAESEVHYGGSALRVALFIGCNVFIVLFIIFDQVIECLGMDALLSVGKKSGKPLKKRPRILVTGIVFILIGHLSLLFYWGKISQSIPTALVNTGMWMLLAAVAGVYLIHLSRKENRYYKKIIWLENWYHRFFYNINMSFVIAAFLVIVMTDFSVKLLDNIPIREPENYPYDLVWMADHKDTEFLKHLKERYNVQIQEQPCIRVTTTDIAEHTGISISQYEKWSGNRIELKGKEIFVVYQRERSERNKLGIGFDSKNPPVYIGKTRPDLWLYVRGMATPRELIFNQKFKIIGSEERILTGVFESNICEHIIVFSDEYYQEASKKADGANLAVMMQIPEEYEQVVEEIKAYAAKHSQINFFDRNGGNLIYEKSKILLERSKIKLTYIVSAAGNMLIMLICGIFILMMKMECDYPEMEWKYRFYIQSGMPSLKVRKGILKECFLSGGLPVLCGTTIAVTFLGMTAYAKHLSAEWMKRYFIELLGITGGIWLLLSIVVFGFACRNIVKIEGGK